MDNDRLAIRSFPFSGSPCVVAIAARSFGSARLTLVLIFSQ
jgi:hypothetical protein